MFWYNVVYYLFIAIIIYIPVVHKIYDETILNNVYKKTTTPIGYFFIIAVIISFLISLGKDELSDDEKNNDKVVFSHQHSEDSIHSAVMENKINNLGYIFDSSKNAFVFIGEQLALLKSNKSNSIKHDVPLLSINESPTVMMVNDSMQTVFSIKNYGTSLAKNLQFKILTLVEKKGIFRSSVVSSHKFNEEIFVSPGASVTYYMGYIPDATYNYDNTYLFVEIYYTDEQNKDAKPFRIIYSSPPPKIGNALFEVEPDKYDTIKKLLIQLKYW